MRFIFILLALLPSIVNAQPCVDEEKNTLSLDVLECLEKKLNQVQNEFKNFSVQLKQQQSRLREDLSQSAQQHLAKFQQNLDSLEHDFSDFKREMSAKTVPVLRQKVDAIAKLQLSSKRELKTLAEKIKALATEIDSVKKPLEQVEQTVIGLKTDVEKFPDLIKQGADKFSAQLDNLKSELSSLEENIQPVLAALEPLKTNVTELQVQINGLNSSVKRQSTRLSALEKQVEIIDPEKLVTVLEQTQAQLATLNQKLIALQAADKSQQAQLLQQQHSSQQAQLARLKPLLRVYKQLEQKLTAIEQKIANSEIEGLTELKAQVEKLQQDNLEHQDYIARLEKEVFKATAEEVQPEILEFCVRQGDRCEKNVAICYGEPITIQWKTQYGDAALLTTQRGDFIKPASVLLEDKRAFPSITQPMRFTLVVQNQLSDDDIRTVEETIEIRLKQPEMTLAAKNDQIYGCSGQPVELHWAVSCAKEAQLNGEKLEALTGAKQFALQQPKTFTLLATNGQQTIERQLSFDLQKPVINYFNLSQAAGCYGEISTLEWKTSCADQTTLLRNGKEVEKLVPNQKGTFSLPITQTENLTLVAKSGTHEETKKLEITLQAPEIDFFNLNQETACYDDKITAHWKARCASDMALSYDDGVNEPKTLPVDLEGSYDFNLTTPAAHLSLTATNRQKDVSAKQQIALKAPVIHDFNSSQAAGCYGEVSTLEWETSCADQTTLLRNGEPFKKLVANQKGTVSLPMTQTENLTLMAKSGPYEETKDIQITLQAPEIEFFNLNQETACYDDNISANWKARCASEISLSYDDGVNEPKTLAVDPEGHYDFNMTTPAAHLSLTATNRQQDVSAQQKIALGVPVIHYLRADKRAGCFGDEITATWSASCLKDVHLSVGEESSAVDAQGHATFSLEKSNKRVTLTATNGFQSDKKQVRLTLQEPVIEQFSVNKNQVCKGDTATVAWQVSCASLVSLKDDREHTHWLDALQGTKALEIEQDTELTLVASNGETEMEQAASITTLMPQIQAFSVNNKRVCYGDSISANWQTQCADKVMLKQGDSTQVVPAQQEADFEITILAPQKLTLLAQKGYYLDQKEIDVTLAPPQIDLFKATTAVDSSLDSLCFGEAVELAWQAACAKEVTLMDQTVAEKGQLSVTPTVPGDLVLQVNNGIDSVDQKYPVAFQAPQITRFCGPSDVIFLGDRYSFNWEGRCNAGYRLKSVDGADEQYNGTDNEATITLSSAEYQLTAHNHAGENPEQVSVDLSLKLTPKQLISIDLPGDSLKPFFITQYEVTQAEYLQCESCNQYQPQDYQGLYCITRIDPANKVIVGQKGYHPSAIACLSLDEATYFIEGLDGFRYEQHPDSLGISNEMPTNSCTLELGGSLATGLVIWGETDYPVSCVSRQDAIQFANWRSQQEQLPRCYDEQGELVDKDCIGYRLPTSAEWQLAALGNNPTKKRWFPWGKAQLDCHDKGQSDCTFPQALPKDSVSKDRSPFGVQDMGLSLSEWTQDLKTYEGEDVPYAITRGHHWASKWPIRQYTSRFSVASARDMNEYLPNERQNVVGFRLVRLLPKGLPVMDQASRCVIDEQSPILAPEPIQQPQSEVTPEVEDPKVEEPLVEPKAPQNVEEPLVEPEAENRFEGWEYDE